MKYVWSRLNERHCNLVAFLWCHEHLPSVNSKTGYERKKERATAFHPYRPRPINDSFVFHISSIPQWIPLRFSFFISAGSANIPPHQACLSFWYNPKSSFGFPGPSTFCDSNTSLNTARYRRPLPPIIRGFEEE